MHIIIHHEFIIIRGLFLLQKKFKFILFIHLTKYTFVEKGITRNEKAYQKYMVSDQTLSKRTKQEK